MGAEKSGSESPPTPPRPNGSRWAERAGEWRSPLAILVAGFLAFCVLSGLAIWLLPFSIGTQVTVFVHTLVGLVFLFPSGWYLVRHWRRYWRNPLSHIHLLGYIGAGLLILCLVSGVVLTWQATLGIRITYSWDILHIITTLAILAFVIPHLVLIVLRDRKAKELGGEGGPTRRPGT